jgi:hypothetical protein
MFVVQRIRAGSLRIGNVSKHIRFLSGKKDKAPAEFYDENLEEDKEFFDIVTSVKKGNSLRSMSTLHVGYVYWRFGMIQLGFLISIGFNTL